MATKKLKVEVELETAKAKRQAKDLEQTAGSGGGSAASSGKNAAASLDKVARSAEKSAGAFDKMSGTSARLTRGFAGIAVGMATSYAANYATGGTKTALEYGGNAISGAVGGAMMAGLPGAIVGGLAGVLKTYMDKQGEVSKMSEDFKIAENTYEDNRLWQARIRNLSDIDYSPVGLKGTDLTQDKLTKTDARISEVQGVAEGLFDDQNKILKRINEHLKKGETAEAEKLQKDLAIVRAKKEQAESLEQSYKKQKKSLEHQLEQEKYEEAHKKKNDRGGFSASNALDKVGIAFAGERFTVPSSKGGAGVQPARSRGGAFSFGFAVPASQSETHDFSAAAEGFTDPAIKIADEITAKNTQEMITVLERINENLEKRNGGSTWQ